MRLVRPLTLLTLLAVACGCAHRGPASIGEHPIGRSLLRHRVVVAGQAEDRKAGNCVVTDAGDVVYLPADFKIPDFKRYMHMRVSGVLEEDYNLPVLIDNGQPQGAGIYVPNGTDLHTARHRWVLTDPRIEK